MDMFEDLFGSSNSGWPRGYGAVDPFGRRSYAPNISGMHPMFGRPQSADFRVPQQHQRQQQRGRNLDEYLVPDAAARGNASHPRRQEGPKSAPKAKIIPVSGPDSPKKQSAPPAPPKPNRFANKEDAALKIQCVFRGFSVRRTNPLPHLRKISETKQKLLNFKEQVADPQRVSVIRDNMKERIMLTEGVMNLLLQLDSIQGALPLVREMRKATVREIVQFQESIDSILQQKTPEPETVEQEEAEAAKVSEPESASEEQAAEVQIEVENKPVEIGDGEKEVDLEGNRKDDAEVDLEQGNLEEPSEGAKHENLEGAVEGAKVESIEGTHEEESTPGDEAEEMNQSSEDRKEAEDQQFVDAEELPEAEDDDAEAEKMDVEAECKSIVDSMVEEAADISPRKREREESEELETETGTVSAAAAESEAAGSRNPDYEKMLKKLMDDNAQLKLLVTECLKQTEMQNALICLLNERVQKLEKRSKRNCNRRKEDVF